MKVKIKKQISINSLALLALMAGSHAYASKLPQPDPAGSVLYGRLSDINENGAYFARTPYTEGASRPVGMIVSKLASVSKACSGSVINTSKKNLIITAAHCFAKREGKSWVLIPERLDAVLNKQVSFRPSYDGTKSINDPQRFPFGIWYSKNVYILPASSKSNVDVAILEVNPDENGREIQDVIGGGYDIHAPLAKDETVQASLVGYPVPAPFNAKSLSVCVGNYADHPGKDNAEISRVDSEQECHVGGGSSGGPYLTQGKTPDSPPQVLTVLNSNGGGNVPAVIDELLGYAGASRD